MLPASPAVAIRRRRSAGVRLPAVRFIATGADGLTAALGTRDEITAFVERIGSPQNLLTVAMPAATPVITGQLEDFNFHLLQCQACVSFGMTISTVLSETDLRPILSEFALACDTSCSA